MEILARRRDMLNRVRADLKKVDDLQSEFWRPAEKRVAGQSTGTAPPQAETRGEQL